jgi:tRNA A37 threonylcarbamoyladenosine dehydratase
MDKLDNQKYQRCKLIFKDNYKKLENIKLILFGVGGVGSFCLDCLYRSGITNITIVDYDTYDISNQNRQIGSEKIGKLKVDRLKELYPDVTPINIKVTPDWLDNFDLSSYDYVLDAIDDFDAKIALIKKAYPKIISSMGSAKKVDPTKIEISHIWKTHGDKFTSKIRYHLRKDKFSKKVPVVFSSETAKCKEKGSFVAVTGAFGLAMCSFVINKLQE